jgi:hypothetical protein
VTVRRAGQEEFPPDPHAGQSPYQCVIPEDVLIQLSPPDDERLSLETCRGRKINTLKQVKKCIKLVVNPEVYFGTFMQEVVRPAATFSVQ